jgi:hypothetical protein
MSDPFTLSIEDTHEMRYNQRTEEAARKFFNLLVPGVQWDYTDHKAKPLILAAFHLYAQAWDGTRWDVRQWEWPYAALRGETSFEGDEPWTVLFQRARKLAKTA